ncbi:LuxR C-terminal-related transcriptional regulator [Rouxiella sp. Mn2063]|uniref:LuxR C-terminal-related transcriptional regulator n=1 Tax=Rouxiella sp. Mn2063 TaxID=3395262 RepID=UPI003BE9B963
MTRNFLLTVSGTFNMDNNMPRLVIWSECQYTQLAVRALASNFAFISQIYTLPREEHQIKLTTSDYFMVGPTSGGFSKCYEFLLKNQDNIDYDRVMIIGSGLDMLVMSILFKKSFKFFFKKDGLQDLVEFLKRFILLNYNDGQEYLIKHHLTYNEERVLILMLTGLSETNIANILKRSIKTVSHHKVNLLKKLHIDTNATKLFFLYNYSIASVKQGYDSLNNKVMENV